MEDAIDELNEEINQLSDQTKPKSLNILEQLDNAEKNKDKSNEDELADEIE